MATNPMQRRSRNSFLLGMLTMLLIAAVIIGLLLWQLISIKQAEQEAKRNSVTIYVLSQDVASGNIITPDMLTTQVMDRTLVPANAYGNLTDLENYALEDNNGNAIYTDDEGMYMTVNNSEVRIQEADDGTYYTEENGQRQTVQLSSIPVVAKVDLKANTIITSDLITKSDEEVTADVRLQEYNMITLPTQLQDGDVIDIRFRMPNGEDFIVASKKTVTIPEIAGVPSADTIQINMSELDTLMMSNAIVEAYMMPGSEIYASIYVEPGMQQIASATYAPSADVMSLIENNPNIVNEARQALYNRFNNNGGTAQRNQYINNQLNQYDSEDRLDNLEASIEEHITQQKETRQEYLDSLGAATTTTTTNTTTNTTN